MKALDRAAFLAAGDIKVREVLLPELGDGVGVFVRVMTGAERDQIEAEISRSKGVAPPNFSARFAAMIVCDAEGKSIFTQADAVALSAKSGVVLARIVEAATELNKITDAEVKAAVGESSGGQNSGSGSASP